MAYVKPNPKLREENYLELQSAIVNFMNKQLHNTIYHPYQNCLNCTHWNYGEDVCGKFKAKPPTDILIYSCPEYEDDKDIPF